MSSGSAPIVPRPTLTVDKPIISWLSLATNNGIPSGRFIDGDVNEAFARLVATPIESPVFLL